MGVNINEDDYYRVINDNDCFLPQGVYWPEYVLYNNKQDSEVHGGLKLIVNYCFNVAYFNMEYEGCNVWHFIFSVCFEQI